MKKTKVEFPMDKSKTTKTKYKDANQEKIAIDKRCVK
jgi:hypothetical protein